MTLFRKTINCQHLASVSLVLLLSASAVSAANDLTAPPPMPPSAPTAIVATPLAAPPPAVEPSLSPAVTATPAITVADTAEPNLQDIGLFSPSQLQLPDALWQDMDAAAWKAGLHRLQGGIVSPTLRNLTLRSLVSSATLPDDATDTSSQKPSSLMRRAEALMQLGQTGLARQLLAIVPTQYQTPAQQELFFLLQSATTDAATLCTNAEKQLVTSATPFFKKWVVLCQIKSGEKDKAQLGLDMIREREDAPLFFEKLARGLIIGKAAADLPAPQSLEEAAWLYFSEQTTLLYKLTPPPLAVVSLIGEKETKLPDGWAKLAVHYGLNDSTLKAPTGQPYTPDLRLLQLPDDATDAQKHVVFLAYSLRNAMGLPLSLEIEDTLRSSHYVAKGVVLAPNWQETLKAAADAEQTGKIILLLASTFTEPLNHYLPSDIAAAVHALKQVGLSAEASVLAEEAMRAALASDVGA
jgi:hypothetical protein